MVRPQAPEPRRRRERGDDGISWDRANKCYIGTISLGYDDAGKRLRRTARGKTKQAVKDKLDKLHEEIKAGIETPATYTVRQCVADWLDSLELDPHTPATETARPPALTFPHNLGASMRRLPPHPSPLLYYPPAKTSRARITLIGATDLTWDPVRVDSSEEGTI